MSEPTTGPDAGDSAATTAPDHPAAATPRTLGQVLGENVRRLRYERGLDMLQAVAWFRQRGKSVSVRNLQDLERGTQGRLSFGTVVRVALDWQVPLQELFAGDGEVAVASGVRLSREQLRKFLRETGRDDPPPAIGSDAPASAVRDLRWTRLCEDVHQHHPHLRLWPGLLEGGPVQTFTTPAGEQPQSMRQFLATAADLGVTVVYGRFLDQSSPHHHARIQPAPGDTVLVLQYPASGGVVHNWTGRPGDLGEPPPRPTPFTSGR